MRYSRILLSALGVGLLAACGASSGPDLHAAFAAIQVDEARIANAAAERETSGDEDERAALATEICDAASHLRETAAPLHDRDATARSEHATATCEATRTQAAP